MESGGGDLQTHLFVPSSSCPRVRGGVALSIAEFLFFAPSTNTYIFRLSPLWMCVHGVVLTKKDLVQAPFQSRFVWRCSSEPVKRCILYLCNAASIKRLLYCLFLWLPISDAARRKVAPHANECRCNLSRLTAACVMKCTGANPTVSAENSGLFLFEVFHISCSARIFKRIDLSILISHLCYSSHFTTGIRRKCEISFDSHDQTFIWRGRKVQSCSVITCRYHF